MLCQLSYRPIRVLLYEIRARDVDASRDRLGEPRRLEAGTVVGCAERGAREEDA
jgi:hypothetical protein